MSASLRATVAKGVTAVISKGKSLTEVLPRFDVLESKDKALARELTFGTLRHFVQLEAFLGLLLDKPLKNKDADIQALILIGLYQLFHTRIPDHAVLSETVQATMNLKKLWAKNLVNAILRKALSDSERLLEIINKSPSITRLMPKWIFKRLKQDWPDSYLEICNNSHQRAPLTLRVNSRQIDRDSYLKKLQALGIKASIHEQAKQAILLEKSCDITSLPGFHEGDFSVQDSAAQMAAQWLDVEPGQNILDACAAPGGKTAHILELTDNKAKVTALDNSARRLERLKENLERLNLTPQSIVADAIDTASWFDGEEYDRILCDAPCSALGIIRRHPDIAILRKDSDIEVLTGIQQQLLQALWLLLKPGGILLYSTCSILKAENEQQIESFLQSQSNAKLLKSWQIMPAEQQMDGFYYAKLQKLI